MLTDYIIGGCGKKVNTYFSFFEKYSQKGLVDDILQE